MHKLKTKKSVIKRFKISKKGKILRGSQYARHLRIKKSKRRIRRFKEAKRLTSKQARMVKSMINI